MHSWDMNIKVGTKECPFIYGHMETDMHNPLTPSSQWRNNRKGQMLIVLNPSNWSHVSPILSRVLPDKAYLGKDLSAGKDRLFKHQTKGQRANGWIERLNDSYFTLHWVFLSSSMMARAFWPARAVSHREPADQYALHEQTLDWRAEFSK